MPLTEPTPPAGDDPPGPDARTTRREWIAPALVEMPRLTDLTLQSPAIGGCVGENCPSVFS